MNSSTPVQADPNSTAEPRSLVKSQIWVHLFFFLMAAIVITLSFTMRSEGQTAVYLPGTRTSLPAICTTKVLLGIDCPGCGLTRAFISISNGQLARAWAFNQASIVMYLFIAGQLPWQSYQMFRLISGRRPIDAALTYQIPLAVVATLLLGWVWKMIHLI